MSGDREFVTYTLAISDMEHVAYVARLVAEHDPLFNEFGPIVSVPPGMHPIQQAALQRRAEGIATTLRDFKLKSVLETGLVVTYARPFSKGIDGFPIPKAQFVPANRRQLHNKMLGLRNRVQAHMAAIAPEEGFQRRVTRKDEPGVKSWTFGGPRYLHPDELRELSDLADEVIASLESAGGRRTFPVGVPLH